MGGQVSQVGQGSGASFVCVCEWVCELNTDEKLVAALLRQQSPPAFNSWLTQGGAKED